ncbi:hypothetical protein AK812_SmicGene29856 [Symbiodinium microadriaticum]|uniref:Uncharacterized protein n=1 Tax=Symbiodinium microadriaticum TaxID=2951 RepID=A0A1Q9D0U5_SYMMI|nr:hypothetical protein AK812_SmicGene29856 [Symbiodinium microadriaticum]CAE7314212.1 unnamed protein product [Symbiodinium microadriaticum]
MTAHFSVKRGWPDDVHPAKLLTTHLGKFVSDVAIDQIQPRMNALFAFLCHTDKIDTLLKASGQDGIFIKSQSPDIQPLELLWLPEDLPLEKALVYASDARVMGVAEKGATGKLALRFRDVTVLSNFAKEKNFQDSSLWARWRITGFPVGAGIHGLHQLLLQNHWSDVEVLYLDDRQAVFHAANRGDDKPLFYTASGQKHQLRFKALNSLARGMSKDARVATSSATKATSVSTPTTRKDRQFSFLREVDNAMVVELENAGTKRPPYDHTGGKRSIVFAAFDGHAGAGWESDKKDAVNRMLRDLSSEMAGRGGMPIIVTGDFNIQVDESTVIREMLRSGGWVDAHAFADADMEAPLAMNTRRKLNPVYSLNFKIVGGSFKSQASDVGPTQVEEERLDKWKGTITRLKHIPLHWQRKAKMLVATQSQSVYAQGTHTFQADEEELKKVPSTIMRTMWQTDCYSMSPYITFALLLPAQLDPMFGRKYHGLRTLHDV